MSSAIETIVIGAVMVISAASGLALGGLFLTAMRFFLSSDPH